MLDAIVSAYRCLYLQLAGFVGLGWGIVLLSVICSILMIPLMRLVAGVVKREADYQAVIMPQLADIKARYASDVERHLHIQRLYRRYCYSPLSAVKKVLPLFVQIPFLLLTYFMLKDTAELHGVPFLFLKDLGRPDALFTTFNVNILPIVMTAVNIVTVFATPGFTSRDWTQAIGISLLFLFLLYTAPSALLLYWTLNNVITLFRTLVGGHRAGWKLLISRIASLKDLPRRVFHAITPKTGAYVSLSLFLLTLYFCGTAKLMMEVNGGITCNVMYRGMAFVLAMASIAEAFHLRKETFVRKPILYFSVISCVGFALLLAGLFFFSRMAFKAFLGWVHLFVAVPLLAVLWMMPYLFVKNAGWKKHFSDFIGIIIYDAWLLLFPIILAVHYAYASEVFVLPFGSLVLLCLYMVTPCVALALLLILMFGRWINKTVLFRICVGVFVGIYLIPLISTETGMFAYNRNLLIRLVLISVFAVLFTRLRNRKVGFVFQIILFLTVAINAVINHGKEFAKPVQEDGKWRERLERVVGDAHCVKSNNVYLLVYDAYGHRSILDGLRLQDDEIYGKLKEKGYTLYDAYSTGADTLASMSAMFTLGGEGGDGLQATVSGDNVFCDLLREAGYKTSYILLGYLMPQKDRRKPGDYYFPGESQITRPEMVLLPCILRGALSQSPSVFDSYSMEEWLVEKHNALSQCPSNHSFVYAHMEYPAHAPWHPRYRKTDGEEQRMYAERLVKANEQMIKDIEFLERDPNAIVILMSDHGGSLIIPQKNGEWGVQHLIDHFGVFLAIRWPKDYKPTLQLNCLQNVFVEVMVYLTGDPALSRLENPGVTVPLDYPFGTPAGVIKNGVIQFGEGAGENLFRAARRSFGVEEESKP